MIGTSGCLSRILRTISTVARPADIQDETPPQAGVNVHVFRHNGADDGVSTLVNGRMVARVVGELTTRPPLLRLRQMAIWAQALPSCPASNPANTGTGEIPIKACEMAGWGVGVHAMAASALVDDLGSIGREDNGFDPSAVDADTQHSAITLGIWITSDRSAVVISGMIFLLPVAVTLSTPCLQMDCLILHEAKISKPRRSRW